MNAGYSEKGALAQIGAEVMTIAEVAGIPLGTRGKVIDADEGGIRGWVVRVEWNLPPERSYVMAQILDISINMPWETKHPSSEFTKGEVERVLRSVET
jgi:hypothetical protein